MPYEASVDLGDRGDGGLDAAAVRLLATKLGVAEIVVEVPNR